MACAKFHSRAAQLVTSLEARGRQFLQSSTADIPVSQLEDPLTADTFYCLAVLPTWLGLNKNKRFTLAEARSLYNSRVLDTLCSILSRLQWGQFCNQHDAGVRGGWVECVGQAAGVVAHAHGFET